MDITMQDQFGSQGGVESTCLVLWLQGLLCCKHPVSVVQLAEQLESFMRKNIWSAERQLLKRLRRPAPPGVMSVFGLWWITGQNGSSSCPSIRHQRKSGRNLHQCWASGLCPLGNDGKRGQACCFDQHLSRPGHLDSTEAELLWVYSPKQKRFWSQAPHQSSRWPDVFTIFWSLLAALVLSARVQSTVSTSRVYITVNSCTDKLAILR